MKRFLSKIKESMSKDAKEELDQEEGYVELTGEVESSGTKIMVRPFTLNEFEDIKEVLDLFRKGNTICLVNIKPLKDKDILELKRAINKLKKTTDANEGEIAGFSEDWIVVTPSFATIYKTKQPKELIDESDFE